MSYCPDPMSGEYEALLAGGSLSFKHSDALIALDSVCRYGSFPVGYTFDEVQPVWELLKSAGFVCTHLIDGQVFYRLDIKGHQVVQGMHAIVCEHCSQYMARA